MPTEWQESLSQKEKEKILKILNSLGKFLWEQLWHEDMAIPRNLNVTTKDRMEQELILRYLFMRVALNQQGDSIKIRRFAKELVEDLGREFLISPLDFLSNPEVYDKILLIARKYGGEKGSELYSPGRLRGIKPFYILMSRLSLFALFIHILKHQKASLIELLEKIIKDEEAVLRLNDWIMNEKYISLTWVGKDPKASRMLTNWIIFLWTKKWNKSPSLGSSLMRKTLMIVDGHVGKVFARTGLLEKVTYESNRPYIIEASKMRSSIEKIVNNIAANKNYVPFYIDYAAFTLGMSICDEVNPLCEIDSSTERKKLINEKQPYGPIIKEYTRRLVCPLEEYCKKYTLWTAYRQKK